MTYLGDDYDTIEVLIGEGDLGPIVCPPCKGGDHFNHAFKRVKYGPIPRAGGCYSLANKQFLCTCKVTVTPKV